MEYFRRILTHYLTTALRAAGVRTNEEVYSEMNAAMEDLDTHIEKRIAAAISEHERRTPTAEYRCVGGGYGARQYQKDEKEWAQCYPDAAAHWPMWYDITHEMAKAKANSIPSKLLMAARVHPHWIVREATREYMADTGSY